MSEERQMLLRSWTSRDAMIWGDLCDVVENLGDVGWVTVSRGVVLKWESPETDEEMERRLRYVKDREERTEKWEREKYAELREKYGD